MIPGLPGGVAGPRPDGGGGGLVFSRIMAPAQSSLSLRLRLLGGIHADIEVAKRSVKCNVRRPGTGQSSTSVNPREGIPFMTARVGVSHSLLRLKIPLSSRKTHRAPLLFTYSIWCSHCKRSWKVELMHSPALDSLSFLGALDAACHEYIFVNSQTHPHCKVTNSQDPPNAWH